MKTILKQSLDDFVTRHLPENVTVTWRFDGKWHPAHTNENEDGSGKTMLAPYPINPFHALVFLHECAHFANGDFRGKYPSHVEEYRAERQAMSWWRTDGHKVPKDYLAEAKRYVRECIAADRRRGVPITPRIKRWAFSK